MKRLAEKPIKEQLKPQKHTTKKPKAKAGMLTPTDKHQLKIINDQSIQGEKLTRTQARFLLSLYRKQNQNSTHTTESILKRFNAVRFHACTALMNCSNLLLLHWEGHLK